MLNTIKRESCQPLHLGPEDSYSSQHSCLLSVRREHGPETDSVQLMAPTSDAEV